ncbi:lytic transglycosylase domain-containing protein [Thioclava sp. GXIMD4216]|uniref:Lytic transglycosylase domain-containing protein n=2 Tax=Paracoccaceae TaxID=31989 RepID=A0ABZ1DXM1_9RHOB|nr:lytic transglycosylase domain-containing protein [Thioclava sp. FTW29]
MMRIKAAGTLLALITCAISVASSPAIAEGLRLSGASSSNRTQLFRNQTQLLDSRAAGQYEHSSRLRPDGKTITAAVIPSYTGKYRGKYMPIARAAAQKHGVPPDLFLRLIQQESGWNPQAVSHAGARGLAQLMPATAAKLNVDISNPEENLDGGARYLRMMYDRFGNWRHALAAYNAGPEAVAKYNGIPPYQETMNYVKVILGS